MAFPSPEDLKLQGDIEDLRQRIEAFDAWVVQFARERESSSRPLPKALSFQILDLRRRVKELSESASVPVALTLYGASQCGKSLLVGRLIEPKAPWKSALGLCDEDSLGAQLDFVRDINPQLGNEATAVVTRFTLAERMHIPPELAAYPVRAKLLSAADLLKALGRGFYTECAGERVWTEAAIRELLKELETQYPGSVDAEWRADLSDAYRYLHDGMRDHLLKADPAIFSQMLLDAPLTDEGYVKLACHLFWEDWKPISLFFEGLLKLRREAFGHCDAVLMAWPVVHFILDTYGSLDYDLPALGGTIEWREVVLRKEAGHRVLAYGGDGENVPLDPLQGLVAELYIPVRGDLLSVEATALFTQADCLDIPGGRRRRGSWATMEAIEEQQGIWRQVPHGVLKRGRVGLMFDKYAEELQATAVLYLQAIGNLEARGEIATQINRWGIARFRQRWPTDLPTDERAAPSLFIGLTKLDLLMKLNPDPEAFQSWLGKELADYFASWINSYGGKGETFTNIHLLRYPGTMDEVEPAQKLDVQTWRRAFLESPVVRKYVADPEAKWDAAFEPGDAGLSLLLDAVLKKLDNAERRQVLAERAAELHGALEALMRGLYVDPAPGEHADRCRRVADAVVKVLLRDYTGLLTRALLDALHIDAAVAEAAIKDTLVEGVCLPDFKSVAARILDSWQRTRDWRGVCSTGQPGAEETLDEGTLTELASHLAAYLASECLPEIVDRLASVHRLGDEDSREVLFRRYAEMMLDDYLVTPGPRQPRGAGDVLLCYRHTWNSLRERWARILAERLLSGVKEGRSEGAEVPRGNEELGRLLEALRGENGPTP